MSLKEVCRPKRAEETEKKEGNCKMRGFNNL